MSNLPQITHSGNCKNHNWFYIISWIILVFTAFMIWVTLHGLSGLMK